MLEVRHLSKSFGGLTVLNQLTLEVASDELVGLIGPNGAGKSTLFAVISGFERADQGEIRFAGSELTHLSAPARARLGLSRTFQVPRPFAHMTVRQNLAAAALDQAGERLLSVFLRPRRVRQQEADIARRVAELIEFLTLDRVAEQRAGTLSGGQRKLLELGRALMTQPKLLLLDEPFAGVNPTLIEVIAQRIRELHQRGIGCLVVEHNLQALRSLVGRMIVMDWGRLLADGTPQQVLDDPAVQDAYIGGRGAA